VTSEANISGSYFMVGFYGNDFGPSACSMSYTDPQFVSPSGPSVYNTLIFNANSVTVTGSKLSGYSVFAGSTSSWIVGNNTNVPVSVEGTAVQQGTTPNNSYVWVTSNASQSPHYGNDALWRCKISTFPTCAASNNPVCVNPGANLDFPDFPAISSPYLRIYVPNQGGSITGNPNNAGTVSVFRTAAACVPKATLVDLQTPVGVAVER